jgi:hypothetical protein
MAPIVQGPKRGARQHTDGVPGKVVLSTIDGQKLTKAIALGPDSFLNAKMVLVHGDRTPLY